MRPAVSPLLAAPAPPVRLRRAPPADPASTSGGENGGGGWQVLKHFGEGPDGGARAALSALAASPGDGKPGALLRSPGPDACLAPTGSVFLFLGGFFVLRFWANAVSGAEKGWGGLQLWAARGSPGPRLARKVSIKL